MNENEAKTWLDVFLKNKQELEDIADKEIIIGPTFTLLPLFKSRLADSNIKLSAQNISPFDEGAFTGEVNGKQIKDYAEYVIIGHSERRTNFNEANQVLGEKVKMAYKYGLKPIYCAQGKDTVVPEGIELIAYEPVFAIGSGNPDTPENAEDVCASFVGKNDSFKLLYGGSVTPDNVNLFTKRDKISGVLVGGASLDPQEFISIIKNA